MHSTFCSSTAIDSSGYEFLTRRVRHSPRYAFRMLASLALGLLFSISAIGATDVATYTATVVPSVAVSGGSVKVRIQISAFTSDAEKGQLKEAFSKDGPDKGVALLGTMSKGYINIAGQSGRKIMAAFSVEGATGKRLIIIMEHILSLYEQTQGVRAADYPLTIIRIQFDANGKPVSGDVYPAAKLSVTKDGFLDVDTQTVNTGTLIEIVRIN